MSDRPVANIEGTLPPVSVIMAAYNAEEYIAEAIESVLCQTHNRFELIIIDDGSTDSTLEITKRYAAQDARIRSVTQPNMDQPASLNRALAMASNEWVAVLDADDVCMPERLERQLRALVDRPLARVLGTYAIEIDARGAKRGVIIRGPTTVAEFQEMLRREIRISLVHPSVIMHRPTILALGGYDGRYGAAADIDLWSRVSDRHVVMSLPEPLVYYRIHEGCMSVTRFFEQQRMTHWIDARGRARRQGLAEPALEQYLRSQRGRFFLSRPNQSRKDWVLYLIRHSRLAWWSGQHARALSMRLVALILDPFEVVMRVRQQLRSRFTWAPQLSPPPLPDTTSRLTDHRCPSRRRDSTTNVTSGRR